MNGSYLPPRLIQAIGLLLVVFLAAVWALTGRNSAELLGVAVTLATGGTIAGAWASAKQNGTKSKGHDRGDDAKP